MSEQPAVPHDRYAAHWLITFALLIGLAAFYWFFVRVSQPPPNIASASVPSIDSYLLLRMPEVPLQEPNRSRIIEKYRLFLDGLQAHHFQPMHWSEVLTRLDTRKGLPERTVVLLFDPAYRQTYEAVGPLFEQRGIVANWTVHRDRMDVVNRHYLHAHAREKLKRSGIWELVNIREEGTVEIERQNQKPIRLEATEASLWVDPNGRLGLNQGLSKTRFHRLHVNAAWNEREFIDRLLAELPVYRVAYLTTRSIQNHTWGIAQTDIQPQLARFTLRAPPDHRSASLRWTSTRTLVNYELELKTTRAQGELWVFLRCNEATKNGIYVGFSTTRTMIDEEVDGVRKRLLETVPPAQFSSQFSAVILLSGNTLNVFSQDQLLASIDRLRVQGPSSEGIRLMTYDIINGAAHAEWTTLRLTPIHTGPL